MSSPRESKNHIFQQTEKALILKVHKPHHFESHSSLIVSFNQYSSLDWNSPDIFAPYQKNLENQLNWLGSLRMFIFF